MTSGKSPEDPMDLGGFMQNFVLSNPFREASGAALAGSAAVGAMPPCEEESSDREHVITDHRGQVLDTAKGHVGSNTSYASALRLRQVATPHVKLQKWLKENYCYVPDYSGFKSSKQLLAEINEKFAGISSNILSKVMTFTFPDCPKVTVNNGHGYQGLVSKPQPEDYCNIEVLKAAKRVQLLGSVFEAAERHKVSAAAVASMTYWHHNEAPMDTSEADTENTENGTPPTRSRLPRRCKNRKLPQDFLDPENLSDIEDAPCDLQTTSDSQKNNVTVKTEDVYGDLDSPTDDLGKTTRQGQDASEQGAVCSMLQTLLRDGSKRSPRKRRFSDPEEIHRMPQIVIKPEPSDPGYDRHSIPELSDRQHQHTAPPAHEEMPTASCKDGSSPNTSTRHLKSKISKLEQRLEGEKSKRQVLASDLSSSRKQVIALKSTVHKQQAALVDLAKDFSALNHQFRTLADKFTSVLATLAENSEILENNNNGDGDGL